MPGSRSRGSLGGNKRLRKVRRATKSKEEQRPNQWDEKTNYVGASGQQFKRDVRDVLVGLMSWVGLEDSAAANALKEANTESLRNDIRQLYTKLQGKSLEEINKILLQDQTSITRIVADLTQASNSRATRLAQKIQVALDSARAARDKGVSSVPHVRRAQRARVQNLEKAQSDLIGVSDDISNATNAAYNLGTAYDSLDENSKLKGRLNANASAKTLRQETEKAIEKANSYNDQLNNIEARIGGN